MNGLHVDAEFSTQQRFNKVSKLVNNAAHVIFCDSLLRIVYAIYHCSHEIPKFTGCDAERNAAQPEVSLHNAYRHAEMLKSHIVGMAFVLAACTSPTPSAPAPVSSAESEVALRLAEYTELLRRQDALALSAMFELAGSMGHQGQPPIIGRPSIQAFLESLAN